MEAARESAPGPGWRSAPLPPDEDERLAALAGYRILDTPPEEAYDDLALLAASICGTPIAVITFVDAERQWFKARVGLDAEETPRDVAFCAHAIAQPDLLVVPDALADERFAGNPLVTGEPGIRFYAGAPLVTPGGHALGTICAIDRVPRELPEAQATALRVLARQVVAQLELRRALAEARQMLVPGGRVGFRELLERVPAAVFIDRVDRASPTGYRALWVSPRVEELTGVPAGEWVAEPGTLARLLHPEDREGVLAEIARCLASGETFRMEYRIVRPDGAVAWLHDEARVALDEAGSPAFVEGVLVDLTELKRAERHRTDVLERVSDAFVALDRDWRYTYVNEKAGEMFGRRPEDLVGKHIWTEFPEGVGQPFHLAYERALAEQAPIELEEYYPPYDRWFENRIYPSPDGLTIYFHDVTDRKRAELALRESEERFRTIVENASEGIWTADAGGTVTFANEQAAALLGYEVDEIVGRSPFDFMDEEAVALARKMQADRREGRVGRYELRMRRRDGSEVWGQVSASPLLDAEGRFTGSLGLFTDLTERRRDEAERERLLARLSLLAEIDHAIVAAGSPAELAETTAERVRGVLGAERVSVLVADEAAGELVCLAVSADARTALGPGARFPATLVGGLQDLRSGRLVAVSDLAELREPAPAAVVALAEGFRSGLYLPLVAEGDLVGVLGVSSRAPGLALAPEDKDALREAGGRLGVGLRQALLREERERLLERLTAVETIVDVALGRLPLDELLRELLTRLRGLLATDTATVLLLEEEEEEEAEEEEALTVVASVGLEAEVEGGLRIPVGQGFAGRIAAARAPLVVEDARQFPVVSALLRDRVRSLAGAPLEVEGRLVGVVHVGTVEPRCFGEEDVALLELAASRAAAAIARIRAEERRERLLGRLRGLREIDGLILAAESPAEIARVALAGLREAVPCEQASVVVLDPDAGAFELLAVATDRETAAGEGRRFPLEGQPLDALRRGDPYIVPDLALLPERTPIQDVALAEGLRSLVGLPAVVEGELTGALNLLSERPGPPFSREELEIAHEVADHLAVALRQARLREALERHGERLELMGEIDRAILAARSSEEIATAALSRLVLLIPCRGASVRVFDYERGEARLLAATGEHGASVPATVPLVDSEVLDRLRSGEPGIIPDFAAAPALGPVARASVAMNLHSSVSLPLLAEGELIGSLNLVFGEPGPPVSPTELAEARQIADQIALALHQARLREALERSAEELVDRVAERTEELAERNAELDAFAYTVSHDLRAPLRAMQGFSQALLEDYGDGLEAEARAYATRIADAAGRLDELISDLLVYSRLTRAELAPERIPLDAVVAQVLRDRSAELEAAGATVEIGGTLPAVIGHGGTLVHVLGNLLDNAVKFARPGVAPRVRLRAEHREGRVRLWVVDNGIGIEPEHLQRIFRPFERLHGREFYPGTGIGLAIVQKGVERMGGQAGVDSVAGQGSGFWIELPAATGSRPA